MSPINPAQFCLILVIFLARVTANNNGVTIELNGKFTQDFGGIRRDVSTSGKFDFERTTNARIRRSVGSGVLLFEGRITLRSPGEVIVIGVNASLQHRHLEEHVPLNSGHESNRANKRSHRKKVPSGGDTSSKKKLALFGQFQLGPEPRALNVKLIFETQESSIMNRPYASDNIMEPLVDYGFKGTLSARNHDSTVIVNFVSNFGINAFNQGQVSAENRIKRECQPTTLKLTGQLTTKKPRYDGRIVIIGTAVNGEGTLELVDLPAPSPRDEFDAADERTPQFIFETHGNVTKKLDATTVFSAPFGASLREHIPIRKKRNAEDDAKIIVPDDQKVTEWEYDGIISSQMRKRRKPEKVGITAISKLWLISRTKISV